MNLRQYEIVTDVDKLQVDIQEVCKKYKTIKQWAYINHDKDDTRPHYHIYLNFGKSSCDSKMVAEWFKVPENFIEKVKGHKTDMLMYLTHGNESQKNKHQYSVDEVISNFDFQTEIEASLIIGDFEKHSYAEQLKYVNSLPIHEKTTWFNKLEKLWKIHCQALVLNPDRNIEVLFIYGGPGTGKTYYAKKLLESMGLDYCISSSSNDPLQDYMGQKAIIFDDLRDDSFSLPDLLKVLDNHTNSSVKSRFNNKVFNGEVIVITSSVDLKDWYKYDENAKFEDMKQLYRRVSSYAKVTKADISIYSELSDNGSPIGIAQRFVNGLMVLEKKSQEKVDFAEKFSKICESVKMLEQASFLNTLNNQEKVAKGDLPF